jgi:hypothetical protein
MTDQGDSFEDDLLGILEFALKNLCVRERGRDRARAGGEGIETVGGGEGLAYLRENQPLAD